MKHTNQSVFDAALDGVRAQGYLKSAIHGACVYRSDNGLKCGIGHAIPDDIADGMNPYFNSGSCVSDLCEADSAVAALFADCDENLLGDIQQAHDNYASSLESDWGGGAFEDRMQNLANTYNLNFKELT